MNAWNEWWHLLQQPAYGHVLLNPLPVYGLAMGIVALVLALIFREKRVHTVALVLVALACLTVWPVMESGERAAGEIAAARSWIDEHAERAERGVWVYYATAALAVMGLIAHWTLRSTRPG